MKNTWNCIYQSDMKGCCTLWASCRGHLTVWHRTCWHINRQLVYVCEWFLCLPGKRDGREMANQRTAAVAVPCCTTATPTPTPLWGISIKQAVHYLECLAPVPESRSLMWRYRLPTIHCLQEDQPISLVHAKCFSVMMIIYGYNWDFVFYMRLCMHRCVCVCGCW